MQFRLARNESTFKQFKEILRVDERSNFNINQYIGPKHDRTNLVSHLAFHNNLIALKYLT